MSEERESVVVSVDALGGDNAPDVVLKGVEMALADDSSLTVLLVGPDDVVTSFSEAHERCEAVMATEFIDMGEHPASAVRKKRDSSIVVGCRLVKEGRAQGFFSAGSTGACMTAATLVMGRIPGIKRPAIVSVIPSPVREVVMCDVGANADCKPEYLLQFAQMGVVYARSILGRENPRVGLLNIGAEEAKGNQLMQETHALLKEKLPEFAGNAEGNDIMSGSFDVIVCDGFTGNVALKTLEGTAKVLMKSIKGVFMKSVKTKIAALMLKSGLKEVAGKMSADSVGGAPLLGTRGICIIGHGSSGDVAICNGIKATATAVRNDLVGLIAEAISSDGDGAEEV